MRSSIGCIALVRRGAGAERRAVGRRRRDGLEQRWSTAGARPLGVPPSLCQRSRAAAASPRTHDQNMADGDPVEVFRLADPYQPAPRPTTVVLQRSFRKVDGRLPKTHLRGFPCRVAVQAVALWFETDHSVRADAVAESKLVLFTKGSGSHVTPRALMRLLSVRKPRRNGFGRCSASHSPRKYRRRPRPADSQEVS